MKRFILLAICLFSMSLAFSQNNGHIKFMGIEVNGQVSTIEQRLTTKGFTRTKDNMYKGKFSGYDVKLDLQKTVKSKTVSGIIIHFGKEVTKANLTDLVNTLKTKYSAATPFDNTRESEIYQSGVETAEGTIIMDFDQKTLSYLDKANIAKNKIESGDDL